METCLPHLQGRSRRRQETKWQFIKSILKTKEYYGLAKVKGLFHFERSRHYSTLFDRKNTLFHSLTFQQNTSLPSEALASWHEVRCSLLSVVRFPCTVTLLLSSTTMTFKTWRSPATQFSVKLWEYLKKKNDTCEDITPNLIKIVSHWISIVLLRESISVRT